MKYLTASNLHDLIKDAQAKRDYKKSYWKTETRIEKEIEIITNDNDNSSFSGYSAVSCSTEERERTVYIHKLNVYELLKQSGYITKIFPVNFEDSTIDLRGCESIFDKPDENQDKIKHSFNSLKWCLLNKKINHGEFRKILPFYDQAEIIKLYKKEALLEGYRNIICNQYPECDPEASMETEVDNILRRARICMSVEPDYAEATKICFDQIKKIKQATDVNEDKVNSWINACVSQLEEMARQASGNSQQIEAALKIYTELGEYQADAASKNRYHIFCFYLLFEQGKNNEALKELEKIPTSDRKNTPLFYKCRGQLRIAQGQYLKAANNFYLMAKYVEAESIEGHRKDVAEYMTDNQLNELLKKIAEKLEKLAGKNEKTIYEKEYFEYIKIAAERGIASAEHILAKILWKSNVAQAEIWFSRAEQRGVTQAYYDHALLLNKKAEKSGSEYDYKRAKMLLKTAAGLGFKPASDLLSSYYGKISGNYQKGEPVPESELKILKRKFLEEDIEEIGLPEPPIKIRRPQPSELEAYFISKYPEKSLVVPDKTLDLIEAVKRAYHADDSEKRRNYMAMNLTLIFTSVKDKKRYVRTITIKDDVPGQKLNIQNMVRKETFDAETLKIEHGRQVKKASNYFWKQKKRDDDIATPYLSFFNYEDKPLEDNAEKHAEVAAFKHASNIVNARKNVRKFEEEHGDVFVPGSKVHCAIYDGTEMYSECVGCRKLTTAQLSSSDLLKHTTQALKEAKYKCLSGSRLGPWEEDELYMLIRIRALMPLYNEPKSDVRKEANKPIIPKSEEKNIKQYNNMLFYHAIGEPEVNPAKRVEPLIFESGTSAKRAKRATPS